MFKVTSTQVLREADAHPTGKPIKRFRGKTASGQAGPFRRPAPCLVAFLVVFTRFPRFSRFSRFSTITRVHFGVLQFRSGARSTRSWAMCWPRTAHTHHCHHRHRPRRHRFGLGRISGQEKRAVTRAWVTSGLGHGPPHNDVIANRPSSAER